MKQAHKILLAVMLMAASLVTAEVMAHSAMTKGWDKLSATHWQRPDALADFFIERTMLSADNIYVLAKENNNHREGILWVSADNNTWSEVKLPEHISKIRDFTVEESGALYLIADDQSDEYHTKLFKQSHTGDFDEVSRLNHQFKFIHKSYDGYIYATGRAGEQEYLIKYDPTQNEVKVFNIPADQVTIASDYTVDKLGDVYALVRQTEDNAIWQGVLTDDQYVWTRQTMGNRISHYQHIAVNADYVTAVAYSNDRQRQSVFRKTMGNSIWQEVWSTNNERSIKSIAINSANYIYAIVNSDPWNDGHGTHHILRINPESQANLIKLEQGEFLKDYSAMKVTVDDNQQLYFYDFGGVGLKGLPIYTTHQ